MRGHEHEQEPRLFLPEASDAAFMDVSDCLFARGVFVTAGFSSPHCELLLYALLFPSLNPNTLGITGLLSHTLEKHTYGHEKIRSGAT